MGTELTFGAWLKQRRRALRLTQRVLGERAGYAGETIRKVEADVLRPSQHMAERLAAALELGPEERAGFIQFARDEPGAEAFSPALRVPASLPHAPLPALSTVPGGNLPALLSSFIGREQQIDEVRRWLSSARLVTLTGPGGIGKSRLALEVGRAAQPAFPHGVWLVELAALADPALVPQAVASALDLREDAGRPLLQALQDALRAKQRLLIWDNCEHLLEACAGLASQLLQAAPHLRILATSREALGLAGEVNYAVPPLALPAAPNEHPPTRDTVIGSEAVRLFSDRAAMAWPDFRLDEANAATVTQVCARLDGIPLALELAAARLKHLRLDDLLARLDDRLRLLTGGSRTALPRQQTLRATIDWSHALLAPAEQVLFRRLAVFAGGWTLDAAEQVCAGDGLEAEQILDLLGALVNKSLVSVDGRAESGQTRYRMLETVRQYALAKLHAAGEAEAVQARLLDYYSVLAEESAPYMFRREQVEWLARLRLEHDNLRAALEYALAAQPATAVRLTGAVAAYWSLHGHWSEGIDWLRRSLAAAGEAPGEWTVRALLWMGVLLTFHDSKHEAMAGLQRALDAARARGDHWSTGIALVFLASYAFTDGRLREAEAMAREALALHQAIGSVWGQGHAIEMLAMLAGVQGQRDATSLYEQSLALFQQLGERAGMGGALIGLAMEARNAGDYDRARQLFEQHLALRKELGVRYQTAGSLAQLALLHTYQGDYQAARALLEEAVAMVQDVGAGYDAAVYLAQLGDIASLQGRHDQAQAHYRVAAELAEAVDEKSFTTVVVWAEGFGAYYQGDLARSAERLRQALELLQELGVRTDQGNVCYSLSQTLYQLGQYQEAEQVLAHGLDVSRTLHYRAYTQLLGVSARLALARGDMVQARRDIDECLERLRRMGAKRDVAEALEWLAAAWARQGQPERAARLLGAAEALRAQIGAPIPAVEQADYDRALALITSQLEAAALEAAWAEGRALSWEQAADYALQADA